MSGSFFKPLSSSDSSSSISSTAPDPLSSLSFSSETLYSLPSWLSFCSLMSGRFSKPLSSTDSCPSIAPDPVSSLLVSSETFCSITSWLSSCSIMSGSFLNPLSSLSESESANSFSPTISSSEDSKILCCSSIS